jgi:hypothetical protein
VKKTLFHYLIYAILGIALAVSLAHAKPKQKGTGLPGTGAPAVKQAQPVHKNSLVGVLRKVGTGIGLGLDIGEYGLDKAYWVVQKADGLWDEYVEGKTN